mmetsp:Transcript_3965/g.6406  ORF Transcript_3965/g.6406 Transcript_3965/m.6406 type:complete len:200 (+) Transcript_3965:802-1401(+)
MICRSPKELGECLVLVHSFRNILLEGHCVCPFRFEFIFFVSVLCFSPKILRLTFLLALALESLLLPLLLQLLRAPADELLYLLLALPLVVDAAAGLPLLPALPQERRAHLPRLRLRPVPRRLDFCSSIKSFLVFFFELLQFTLVALDLLLGVLLAPEVLVQLVLHRLHLPGQLAHLLLLLLPELLQRLHLLNKAIIMGQ